MLYISIGANLPFNTRSPRENVELAIKTLDRLFTVERRSPLYQTPAWPDPNDPPFINAVVSCAATAHPLTILKALHATEAAFGRSRGAKNAPRTLDLDLLAVDDVVMKAEDNDAGLCLPHKSMHERDFVLVPFADIAPDWVHPIYHQRADKMRDSLASVNVEMLATS